MLIETLARNARTHETEKVKIFAKIFTGFTTNKGALIPYKEGFIKITDELSVDHIKILAFVHNRTKNPSETNEKLKDRIKSEEMSSLLKISDERVKAYCEKMIRYGLLRDWSIGKYGYQPGNYALTGYGFEFAEFLISSLDA